MSRVWITHIIWNTSSSSPRKTSPQSTSGLGTAAPPPVRSLLPDHSRRMQVRLQPARLTPLGANGWCDGDTEGNMWLTEREPPKDKIWECDDLAEPLYTSHHAHAKGGLIRNRIPAFCFSELTNDFGEVPSFKVERCGDGSCEGIKVPKCNFTRGT